MQSKPAPISKVHPVAQAQGKNKLRLLTEDDLVDECKKGNRQAQQKVYEAYAQKMLAVCMRYAKDHESAKDMLHEGFIKVFVNIKKFKKKSSLETWITRVMVNHALDELKKKFKQFIHIDEVEYRLQSTDPVEFSKKETKKLTAIEVIEKIQLLPVGYRAVLNLYALENYSHNEIADTLGISVGTSKSQLAKARRMLSTMLKNHRP